MCTPALARFGSGALCREFLAPSIAGEFNAMPGEKEAAKEAAAASLPSAGD